MHDESRGLVDHQHSRVFVDDFERDFFRSCGGSGGVRHGMDRDLFAAPYLGFGQYRLAAVEFDAPVADPLRKPAA